jgi:hypothetical protein
MGNLGIGFFLKTNTRIRMEIRPSMKFMISLSCTMMVLSPNRNRPCSFNILQTENGKSKMKKHGATLLATQETAKHTPYNHK